MNANGSGVRHIDSHFEGDGMMLDMIPPVWSLDGEYLAFMNVEIAGSIVWPPLMGDRKEIYVVREDGTDLVRIGHSNAPPTWSPFDGKLTYATFKSNYPEDSQFEICVVNPDGSDVESLFGYYESGPYGSIIKQVDWSPDGEELLFVTSGRSGVHVVRADGSGDRTVYRDWENFYWPEHPRDELTWPLLAKWSPDGSRIGILVPPQYWSNEGKRQLSLGRVFTVAPDGSDLKVLAEVRNGRFEAPGS